jgi:hypothetical protein
MDKEREHFVYMTFQKKFPVRLLGTRSIAFVNLVPRSLIGTFLSE